MSLLMDALRRAEADKRAAAAQVERAVAAEEPPETFELSLEPATLSPSPPGSVTGEFALPMEAGLARATGLAGDSEEPTLIDTLAPAASGPRNPRPDPETLGRPERVSPHTIFIAGSKAGLSRYTLGLALTTAVVVASLIVLSWRYYRTTTPLPLVTAPRDVAPRGPQPGLPDPGLPLPDELEFPDPAPAVTPADIAPSLKPEAEAVAVDLPRSSGGPAAAAGANEKLPDPPPRPAGQQALAPAPDVPPPTLAGTALKEQEFAPGELRIRRSPPRQDTLTARLGAAYAAFARGDLALARDAYTAVLAAEPGQVDAHLGLGAVALASNRLEDAHAQYAQVLAQRPEDPVATAAMFLIEGGTGKQATATRLKLLLDRGLEAPYLQFALGNHHARAARWGDAQQAYFAAFTGQPLNADYAFNLAVSLDRLGQREAALVYYQRAEALRQPHSAFSSAAARARIAALSAR